MNDWSPIARIYDPLKAGSIDGTDSEPHDHGIIRAMEARYRPNELIVGEPRNTLFVARLSPKTSEAALEDYFSSFGYIEKCRLIRDVVTGFSKCYAFIEFKDKYAVIKAHKEAHRNIFDGNEIFVDYECERTLKGWIPRRQGGGFGGKKESGQLRFGGRHRPFKKPIFIQNIRNDHSSSLGNVEADIGEHNERRDRDRNYAERQTDRTRTTQRWENDSSELKRHEKRRNDRDRRDYDEKKYKKRKSYANDRY